MRGDCRVTTKRRDSSLEGFADGLLEVPVWNQRQTVGSRTPFTIELAGQQVSAALKNPAQQSD
jgi:hypothetical protein